MGVKSASPVDIAIAGLRLESMRMKTISENIANSRVSKTGSGQPYRRKVIDVQTTGEGGIQVGRVIEDVLTPFKSVHMPGHPDADEAGMVRMPNVSVPIEMMDMVMASRAYEANAAILKRHEAAVKTSLELLR